MDRVEEKHFHFLHTSVSKGDTIAIQTVAQRHTGACHTAYLSDGGVGH